MKYHIIALLVVMCFPACISENSSSTEEDTEPKNLGTNALIPTERNDVVDPLIPKKRKSKRVKCPFQGRKRSYLSSREHELACCKKTVRQYKTKWFNGGKYLTTYFDKLILWKCPELQEECDNKTYVFTDYSRLIYDFNCDKPRLETECKPVLTSVLGRPTNTSWDDLISNISTPEIKTCDLIKPCMQVSVYASKAGGFGFYHEVIDILIPFCELITCGFDSQTVLERQISPWTCMRPKCRTNIVVGLVVCGLLATAIILANVTVIFVFVTSPKLRNSQAVYKISLAFADLLVGMIVIPTFMSSLIILFQNRTTMGDVIPRMASNSLGTKPRLSGGYFDERFTTEYISFVGFFTSLSLLVSIYTLMMASFDRFMAIYMPLRYGRHNAKRMAIWTSLILWLIGIVFSALPFLFSSLKYGLVASMIVAASGTSAVYIYSVVIFIPLVVVWVTTLATFISTKGHAKKRQMLTIRRTVSSANKVSRMETRLARTLASMVGIFTLCLLPTVVVLVTSMFIPSIYLAQPATFNPQHSAIFVSFEFVIALILMTNSLWNCFIYNARNEDFKMAAKGMYGHIMRQLGFNVLWKKTRSFATSTMRSRNSTLTTTVGNSRNASKVQKKVSATTLRTTSNNDGIVTGTQTENALNSHLSNTMTMVALKTPCSEEYISGVDQSKAVITPEEVNLRSGNEPQDSNGVDNAAFSPEPGCEKEMKG